jgi:hypothetical protein
MIVGGRDGYLVERVPATPSGRASGQALVVTGVMRRSQRDDTGFEQT